MAATDTPPTGAVRRFSLPCALDAVHRTVALARAFLAEHSVCDSDLMGCELALVEACNNAVAYAPEGNQQFSLQIQVCCDEDSIELQVIDHTKGFDWPANLKLPSPDEEHGRGLFIIQSLMDEVLYLRGGKENRLVMKKARNQPQARSADLDAEFHREVEAVELAVVEKKLELSEQVIGTMAKELCFRSEELAAIFRCTSELAQKN